MKKTGIELIAEERREQIEKHGFDLKFDLEFNSFAQLVDAAICILRQDRSDKMCPSGWDEDSWNYMINKGEIDRLTIAGALIAAEIDRLQSIT